MKLTCKHRSGRGPNLNVEAVCCTDDCLQEVMQQPEPAIALVNLPSFSHIVRQFKASGGLTNMFVM